MYNIFIGEKCLSLLENRSAKTGNRHLVMHYESESSIITAIETLEQDSYYTSAEIIHSDLSELWNLFQQQFIVIVAAGGLVLNCMEEVLMIFRHNKWDLPKGKLEDGEKKKVAAMREVEEECGISNLEITATLGPTYHTYMLKGKRVLKISYWYEMKTDDSRKLTPQLEEDITEARWVNKKEIPALLENSYSSIKWLLSNWLQNSE